MITIISGTHRLNSRSRKVADCYSSLLQELNVDHQIIDLKDIPQQFIFSAMFESAGKSFEFNQFTSQLKSSEKFVFIVPEYNGSFPGVLKSFIDAMDFPSVFQHKKCALVGISAGSMAGALALSHLTDILNYLGMHVLAIKPRISQIDHILQDGKITDSHIVQLLLAQAKALINF